MCDKLTVCHMDSSVEMLCAVQKDIKTTIQEVFKILKVTISSVVNHSNLTNFSKDLSVKFRKSFDNTFDSYLDYGKAAAVQVEIRTISKLKKLHGFNKTR